MAKQKYDAYDRKVGRTVLVIAKWVAIVAALIGPFVMMFNHNWGLELGTLSVLCGGVALCFGPTGRTAKGQWLALLYTLGVGIAVLLYFALVLKFVHF
ncbi:hypothetical protein ACFQH1_06920 [Lactiplantibacillus daoliensis]|uniref:Integral membrane protein n=1 Tax=Lactiplantibacillus daoliensis TaxID=2559916 RepID=A0ABW1UIX1_9LACO|nr:hypothetical protein [Lactiplantibacillus daoliensis]